MTMVKMTVTGNKAISSIDGFGVDELRKVLKKMEDGYAWHLDIFSENICKAPPPQEEAE